MTWKGVIKNTLKNIRRIGFYLSFELKKYHSIDGKGFLLYVILANYVQGQSLSKISLFDIRNHFLGFICNYRNNR